MMKLYTAKLKNGLNIITVMAEGWADAGSKIDKELNKNPSRRVLFDKWMKDGLLVERKEVSLATTSMPTKKLNALAKINGEEVI
jgi:hypothetical protein